MNKTQRTNTSRLLYRIVEIVIATVIIVNLIPGKEVSWFSLTTGIVIALIAYLIAYWLDGKGD